MIDERAISLRMIDRLHYWMKWLSYPKSTKRGIPEYVQSAIWNMETYYEDLEGWYVSGQDDGFV